MSQFLDALMNILRMESVIAKAILSVSAHVRMHERGVYEPQKQHASRSPYLIVGKNFTKLFPNVPHTFEDGIASLEECQGGIS